MNNTEMNKMERLRESAQETIYLIPDSDEGRPIYLWCDDPAPTEHHVADEAVEYVRRDIYDAALEREQALAAHVERLSLAANHIEEAARQVMTGEMERSSIDVERRRLADALSATPAASLTRRDLIKQAEGVENAVKEFRVKSPKGEYCWANALIQLAAELRQRAQNL